MVVVIVFSLTGNVVLAELHVLHSERVLRWTFHGRPHRRFISRWAGRLELLDVRMSREHRILRNALPAIAQHLRVWVVARAWAAVVFVHFVAHPKRVGRAAIVDAARVVKLASGEGRQKVDGAWAAEHRSHWAARNCVVVDHVSRDDDESSAEPERCFPLFCLTDGNNVHNSDCTNHTQHSRHTT